MHIWIIHQHAVSPNSPGPTRHFELAKELIRRGHKVVIFASNFCHNRFEVIADSYRKTGEAQYIESVPFVWIDSPKYHGNSLARFWNMLVFAYRLSSIDLTEFGTPDVVIGSSPSPFAAYVGNSIAKRFGASFVYEIRDLWPETLLSIGRFKRSHPFVLMLAHIEKTLVKNARAIITALPGVGEYLKQHYQFNPQRLMWLPNFVNCDQISSASLPHNQQKLTVMYAGSFNISNDVITLLQAAKLLEATGWGDRIKIQLVGDGPQRNHFETFVQNNNLSMVEFLPAVSKLRIFELLASADIFVGLVKDSGLYRWGTSLNKITDYMACGRPVIFAINSPFDPITEAEAGLTVAPENPQQLVEAIKQLVQSSREKRRQMGENARKYVEAYYNLRPLVDQLESQILL